jgi:anti-sigma B factor antagonist
VSVESQNTYAGAVENARHFVADDLLGIDVATASTDGTVLVVPDGEIDCVTAPVLRLALVSALRPPCIRIVVDLAAVTFLNSAGLTVLAEAHHLARADGIDLTVRGGSRTVVRPLHITGLWELLAEPTD